jgi:hypothetical protein
MIFMAEFELRCLPGKLQHGLDHLVLISPAQAVVKGQAKESLALLFRHRAPSAPAAKPLAHRREMERDVMEHAQNAP